MALADFRPETDDVSLGKDRGTFAVRGLSLDDLTALLRRNMPELETALATYRADEAAGVPPERTMVKLLQEVPSLAAQVVALASGEADVAETAKLLPFPIQIDALTKCMRLTFEAVGGIKNFGAVLREIAQGIGLDLQSLTKPATTSPRRAA